MSTTPKRMRYKGPPEIVQHNGPEGLYLRRAAGTKRAKKKKKTITNRWKGTSRTPGFFYRVGEEACTERSVTSGRARGLERTSGLAGQGAMGKFTQGCGVTGKQEMKVERQEVGHNLSPGDC